MALRLFLLGLAIVLPTGARADCTQPALAVSLMPQRSVWQEFDARQRRLVRESGNLYQVATRAGATCGPARLSLALAHARGTRDYDGVSTHAAPITSTSAIEQNDLRFELMAPLSAAWSLGTRLGWHRMLRDIAGVGVVQGYPERYTYWLAHAGARFDAVRGPDGLLSIEAWLGGSPGGDLDLRLPNADPATLRLGRSRVAELVLQLQSPPSAARSRWGWLARLAWMQHDIAAGPAKPLTRNGAIVGAALQPKTRHSALGLRVEISAWL